jgi:protein subunit release factor B
MKLNEDFGVSPGKLEELKARIARLRIDVAAIEESFSRGGGKGGQKVNKTANRVQLHYPPLELRVACHRERSRSLNRFFALRELVDQAEMRLSPGTSERLEEFERIRRRKSRSAARSAAKRAAPGDAAAPGAAAEPGVPPHKYTAAEIHGPPPPDPEVPPA